MTPEEKAKSLVEEIKFNCSWGAGDSEQFGIENAVQILINSWIPEMLAVANHLDLGPCVTLVNYWEDVRAELIKLK